MLADRQTNIQTNGLITILRTPIGAENCKTWLKLRFRTVSGVRYWSIHLWRTGAFKFTLYAENTKIARTELAAVFACFAFYVLFRLGWQAAAQCKCMGVKETTENPRHISQHPTSSGKYSAQRRTQPAYWLADSGDSHQHFIFYSHRFFCDNSNDSVYASSVDYFN